MQQVLNKMTAQALSISGIQAIPAALARTSIPAFADLIGELPTNRGFVALLAAYRASGGTARGDDLARLLEEHGMGDFIGLARLIARKEVFGFEWQRALWIPMFQFEPRDLSVRSAAHQVLMELGDGFEGWQCATWFARPNSWLKHRAPVDLLASHLAEVLDAARTDRFIAVG